MEHIVGAELIVHSGRLTCRSQLNRPGRLDGAAGCGAHGLYSLMASQQRRAVRTHAFKSYPGRAPALAPRNTDALPCVCARMPQAGERSAAYVFLLCVPASCNKLGLAILPEVSEYAR